MPCAHDILELAPIDQWADRAHWTCTRCGNRSTGCDHAHQEPTGSGWRCVACRRTLLGPPVLVPPYPRPDPPDER
jgi:hypothetical protein